LLLAFRRSGGTALPEAGASTRGILSLVNRLETKIDAVQELKSACL
jgi:hypothetical protein